MQKAAFSGLCRSLHISDEPSAYFRSVFTIINGIIDFPRVNCQIMQNVFENYADVGILLVRWVSDAVLEGCSEGVQRLRRWDPGMRLQTTELDFWPQKITNNT